MPQIGRISEPQPVDVFIGPFHPQLATQNVAWTAASTARLTPFQVSRPITVTQLVTRIGTASGSVDAGIYDNAGNRLGSTGNIACPTASVTVNLTLTASVTLVPGVKYWLALVANNTSVTFPTTAAAITPPDVAGRITHGAVAASFPLPNPIVLPTTQISQVVGIWI